jgi:uncharacterized protein DUF6281
MSEVRDENRRDEYLGALLRGLPTPDEQESFWVDLNASIAKDASPRKRRGRRRLRMPPLGVAAPAAALLVALVLVISRIGGGSGDGSCAALITWRGHQYRGNSVAAPLAISPQPIGIGNVPACADVPGTHGSSHSVAVYRIVGVSSSKAIAIRGERRIEFIRDTHG